MFHVGYISFEKYLIGTERDQTFQTLGRILQRIGTIVEQKTVFFVTCFLGLISKGSSYNDFNQPQATWKK